MKKIQPFLRIVLSGAFFIVVLMGLRNAFGRVRKIRNSSRFETALSKNLVVALLYKNKRGVDKAVRRKIKNIQRSFKSISDSRRYRYAEINFVSVNTAKEELVGIAERHRIASPSPENPVFALFKGGGLVESARGFLTSYDISKMIDKYFGDQIEKVTKEKDRDLVRRKEDAKRRAYERSYRYYPYWGGYWGGWPYYGGWGGYRRAGWGFGWSGGWGRGGCRGRCR